LQKVNLCEGCSKAKGVEDPTGFALAEMLWGLGTQTSDNMPRERTCRACGLPQSVFRKTGRLGCSQCYTTFADSLGHLLKAMHKGTKHVGKSPEGWILSPPPPPTVNRLEQLHSALRNAVEGEQYEEAARLRDEINREEIQQHTKPSQS
jgi:protein arginine kinase activator